MNECYLSISCQQQKTGLCSPIVFLYPNYYFYLYMYNKALTLSYAGNQQNSSDLPIKEVLVVASTRFTEKVEYSGSTAKY